MWVRNYSRRHKLGEILESLICSKWFSPWKSNFSFPLETNSWFNRIFVVSLISSALMLGLTTKTYINKLFFQHFSQVFVVSLSLSVCCLTKTIHFHSFIDPLKLLNNSLSSEVAVNSEMIYQIITLHKNGTATPTAFKCPRGCDEAKRDRISYPWLLADTVNKWYGRVHA